MKQPNTLLNVSKASLRFPSGERPILDAVDFALNEGDFAVLLGGNGSGKSTLIRAINGLYRIQSGSISMNGKSFSGNEVEEIARELYTLTQDVQTATFGDLTVMENGLVASIRNGGASVMDRKKFASFLEAIAPALADKLDLPAKRLSGGQRQALALAMCMLSPPKLLLLDEHTSALDPRMGEEIMAITAGFIAQHQMTALMTTHNLDHALKYGNRILVMKEGEIIADIGTEAKKGLSKADLMRCYVC